MKGKKVKVNYQIKARRTLSVVIATQLAISLSPLAVMAETEALTNNTLPIAQPAPSQLVQKIWSSLDIRKLAKRKDAAQDKANNTKADATKADATKAENKSEIANKTDASKQDAEVPETSSTAAGVTSTGQMILATPPAPSQTAAADSNIDADIPVPGAVPKPTVSETGTSAASETSSPPPGASPSSAVAEQPKTESSNPTDAAAAASTTKDTFSANTEKPLQIANALISLPPGSVLGRVQTQNEAMVVDNDEVQEVEETIKQEELQMDETKTKAKAGARFPVVINSQLSSKTAKKGDTIQARLKYDLKFGDRVIAKKGAVVNGHVNYSLKARTILHSLVSKERWYRNSGAIGLSFDEIINEKGEHLPLVAVPSRQARIVKNKAEGRELGVNHYGQVTGPWAQQLRYKAIRYGLNFALAPAGVFSFGAMPVALGVLGAVNPSFAFSKPVGLNVRHRRIKGFAWGFLSGIPGSWLIEDTTVKGQEAIIKPGDEFYAEFVQEFTGEPGSDAQLMPNANTKLRGEVVNQKKKTTPKAKK